MAARWQPPPRESNPATLQKLPKDESMGERSQLISIQCHPVHQQLLIGQIRFKAALRRDPTEAARPMEAN